MKIQLPEKSYQIFLTHLNTYSIQNSLREKPIPVKAYFGTELLVGKIQNSFLKKN